MTLRRPLLDLVLAAAVLLTAGCGGGPALRVLMDEGDGSTQMGMNRVPVNGYVVFGPPYVCVSWEGEGPVRLTGAEVSPSVEGLEVTDWGVVPVRKRTLLVGARRMRLRDAPQAVDLVADDVVTPRCDSDGVGDIVWVELHPTRPGVMTTEKLRYVYEVDGETRRTSWVSYGFRVRTMPQR